MTTFGVPRLVATAAFFLGGSLLLPNPASAQTVYCGSVACNTPFSGSATDSSTGAASASADLSQPAGYAIANASTQGNNFYSNANFHIVYSFVIGSIGQHTDSGVIPIPILISGVARAGTMSELNVSGAGADSEIAFSSYNPNNILPAPVITQPPPDCGSTYCQHNSNFNLTGVVNYATVVTITMTGGASASAQPSPDGSAYAYAYADPVITIDPSFADAADYRILFSPGVGNSPVPSPASAWLMLSGLFGLGVVARRCKTEAA